MTDDELVAQILERAQQLRDVLSGGDFQSDLAVQLATERLVEIIGDMVGRFSAAFQNAHPEIDYRGPKRMRNILAHHYQKVMSEHVLNVANNSIPELVAQLHTIANQVDRSNPGPELDLGP